MTQRFCFLIVFLAFTSSAWVRITEYPVTPASSPSGICRGADGGVWFTEEAAGKLGRIWTDGTVQEFVIPTSNPGPGGCADAFDGTTHAIYFTETRTLKLGKFAPVIDPITHLVTSGIFSEWTMNSGASGIVLAPDGYLWLMESGISKVARFNPVTNTFLALYSMTIGSFPHGPTSGPDGNVWFCMFNRNRIARMTLAGVVTEYVLPQLNSKPFVITTAPDGNLYFTELAVNKIGRINLTTFAITQWIPPTANALPYGITAGADGNLYVAEKTANAIGKLPLGGGGIVETPVPTALAWPDKITLGSDGHLWFTEHSASKIGKIVKTVN